MNRISADYLAKAGIIAAAYAGLTLLLSPLSYGVMQIRVSEALCVLPVFFPSAIPGLAIGCFISGILGPNGIIDAVIGTACTIIGAYGTYKLKNHKYLAPIVNVLANGIGIGSMLYFIYDVKLPLIACILWVTAGEAVSCFVFGSALTKFLSTKGQKIFINKN